MSNRAEIDDGFDLIVRAAVRNERCPTTISRDNPAGLIRSVVTAALLKEGKIRIEVYAHNYRVIEILSGPWAGKRTRAPDNKRWKPWRVLPKPEVAAIKTGEGTP